MKKKKKIRIVGIGIKIIILMRMMVNNCKTMGSYIILSRNVNDIILFCTCKYLLRIRPLFSFYNYHYSDFRNLLFICVFNKL